MNRVTVLLIALVAAFALQPATAAATGDCVTAVVDAPFRLPDGGLHPAGSLTLCDRSELSPVAELHTILVDGAAIGVFQSRKRPTEAGLVDAPKVVFEREFDGTLELVGYVLPVRGRSIAYRLNGKGETWHVGVAAASRGGAAPAGAIIALVGHR